MVLVDHDALPVRVVDHALARHQLTLLRDRETATPAFREGLVELGRICATELADAVGGEPTTVETPVAPAAGERLAALEDAVVVSVLRAAVPFVQGLVDVLPNCRQGMVSASRDEATGPGPDGAFPIDVEYASLPAIGAADTVIVADPMLATGSTLAAVLGRLERAERAAPARLFVLSAVAAPAGVERVAAARPDAGLVTVAVDDRLDERGYIVPGLGDAGDRAFGTPGEG